MSNRVHILVLLICSIVYIALSPALAKTKSANDFIQAPECVFEKLGAGKYKLDRGEILANCKKNVEVNTPQGLIRLRRGDLVLISADEKMTRILACFEDSMQPLHVIAFEQDLKIREGQEVALTTETVQEQAERLLAETNLRRRRVKYSHGKSGQVIVEDEVSLLDASLKDQVLSKLAHSQSASERAIAERVAKAVGSMSVLGDNEPYKLLEQ